MSQNNSMRAMILDQPGKPLVLRDRPVPEPRDRQVQLQVLACAVCRNDLHVVDGELPNPKLPLMIGHEIVACVTRVGEDATFLFVGQRVGVPWLGWMCGVCSYCRLGDEGTGRRDYFCARRCASSCCAGRSWQGRNRCFGRRSQERHPLIPLRFASVAERKTAWRGCFDLQCGARGLNPAG
jgi:Zn-dependent alcohol dehydrogenase